MRSAASQKISSLTPFSRYYGVQRLPGVARQQVTFLASPRKVTKRRRTANAALRVPAKADGKAGNERTRPRKLGAQTAFVSDPLFHPLWRQRFSVANFYPIPTLALPLKGRGCRNKRARFVVDTAMYPRRNTRRTTTNLPSPSRGGPGWGWGALLNPAQTLPPKFNAKRTRNESCLSTDNQRLGARF